jgi:hypothetical protein
MRTKEAPAVQQIRRDATHFPAVLTIDWIRAYRRATGPYGAVPPRSVRARRKIEQTTR